MSNSLNWERGDLQWIAEWKGRVAWVEHLKETFHDMVLFDPLPFSNILFIFSIETQNIGVQSWAPWVMPQTTSLLRYKAITIHPLSPSYFKFFSLCLLKRAFSLLMLCIIIRSLCVSRRVLIFFLIIWIVFYFDCALDFKFNSLIKICKKLIENKRRLYLGALIFLELLINNFKPIA